MVRATILFAALPDFSSTLEFFFTGFAIFVSPSFLRLPLWATLCRKQVACQSRSRSVRRQHVNTVGFTGTTRTSTQDGDSDSTLSFSLGVGFFNEDREIRQAGSSPLPARKERRLESANALADTLWRFRVCHQVCIVKCLDLLEAGLKQYSTDLGATPMNFFDIR